MSYLKLDALVLHSDDLYPVGTKHGITIFAVNQEQADARDAAYRKELIEAGKKH